MQSTDPNGTLNPFQRSLALLRTIHMGIGMGPGVFLVLLLVMQNADGNADGNEAPSAVLTFLPVALMVVNAILAHLLFRFQTGKITVPPGTPISEGTAAPYMSTLLSAHILRLALVEGAAIFAGVALLLQMRNLGRFAPDSLHQQLPLAALLSFYVFWALWFPSGPAILGLLEQHRRTGEP